jgi:cell division protease FtsH
LVLQAPSFVFIDEIDALAGKSMNDDAERRATFQQLLAELDGE